MYSRNVVIHLMLFIVIISIVGCTVREPLVVERPQPAADNAGRKDLLRL